MVAVKGVVRAARALTATATAGAVAETRVMAAGKRVGAGVEARVEASSAMEVEEGMARGFPETEEVAAKVDAAKMVAAEVRRVGSAGHSLHSLYQAHSSQRPTRAHHRRTCLVRSRGQCTYSHTRRAALVTLAKAALEVKVPANPGLAEVLDMVAATEASSAMGRVALAPKGACDRTCSSCRRRRCR